MGGVGDRAFRLRLIPAAVAIGLLAAGAPARAQCAGDCDGDARVVVSELTLGVRMVLEGPDGFACAPQFDADRDGFVIVGEVVQAVRHAVVTCPQCPPLTTDFATPCLLTTTARCAGGSDLVLAGVAVVSDGEAVSVEVQEIQPPLRFSGRVRNDFEAELTTFIGPSGMPLPADALLELTDFYTDGRQTYRLFLDSPALVIENCSIEQFFGAFALAP
jgi:hypothetical protein